MANDSHRSREVTPMLEMVAERRSLPEQLRQLDSPYFARFSGGAPGRDIEGFTVGLRTRIGEQGIEVTLQGVAHQQRDHILRRHIGRQAIPVEAAVAVCMRQKFA